MQVEKPSIDRTGDGRALERGMLVLAGLAVGLILGGGAVLLADPNAAQLHEAAGRIATIEADAATLTTERDAGRTTISKVRKELAAANRALDLWRQRAENVSAADSAAVAEVRQELVQSNLENEQLKARLAVVRRQDFQPPPPADDKAPLLKNEVADSKGFTLSNLTFLDEEEVIGEITNNSGEDSDISIFTLRLYDDAGGLVDVVTIVISEFEAGETKPFRTYTENGMPAGGSYRFQLDDL